MGTHEDLLARHREILPSWMALYYNEPIAIVDGEGRHVVDAEGNRYLDMFGGILTTMSGYKIPEVVAAIREQAGKKVLIELPVDVVEPDAENAGLLDAEIQEDNRNFVHAGLACRQEAMGSRDDGPVRQGKDGLHDPAVLYRTREGLEYGFALAIRVRRIGMKLVEGKVFDREAGRIEFRVC